MTTRDVRLDLDQLATTVEAVRRRRGEMRKRVAGYAERHRKGAPVQHGSWDRSAAELDKLEELYRVFEHNYLAARRQKVERVKAKLGMEEA